MVERLRVIGVDNPRVLSRKGRLKRLAPYRKETHHRIFRLFMAIRSDLYRLLNQVTSGYGNNDQPRRPLLCRLHVHPAFAGDIDLEDTGAQRWPDKSLQIPPYCLSTGLSRAVIAKSREDPTGQLRGNNVLAVNGRRVATAGGEVFRSVNGSLLQWA